MPAVRLSFVATFPFLLSAAPAGAEPVMVEKVESFIVEAMDRIDVVPGLGVAIYTPDGTFVRGYGVADIETGEPVTPETAFYIASSTKSLTAMAMAILDARGEIDLDMTIAEFAPDAPFPNDIRTDEVTLRHLLTHTSGLRNNPLGFRAAYTGQHTPQINWQLLSRTELREDAPLGTFDYTNEGYNILTVLTDRKLGMSWQDVVQQNVLSPLGMDETTASMSLANAPGRSIARPHFGGLEGGAVKSPLEKIDATMQSAGGHVMSASDAVRWLEFLIEEGNVDGKQIVPTVVVRSTRTAVASDIGEEFDQYSRDGYGLGWYIGTYKDEEFIHHFGSYAGFRTHISYMPDHDVGVAVFVNEFPAGFSLPDIIANYVYDMASGSETALTDAETAVDGLVDRREKIVASVTADRERRASREWTLTKPRTAYAGTYTNDDYGTVVVSLEGDELVLTMGNLRSVAEPFTREDTIRVAMVPFSGDVAQFIVEDEAVTAITLDGDVFVRTD